MGATWLPWSINYGDSFQTAAGLPNCHVVDTIMPNLPSPSQQLQCIIVAARIPHLLSIVSSPSFPSIRTESSDQRYTRNDWTLFRHHLWWCYTWEDLKGITMSQIYTSSSITHEKKTQNVTLHWLSSESELTYSDTLIKVRMLFLDVDTQQLLITPENQLVLCANRHAQRLLPHVRVWKTSTFHQIAIRIQACLVIHRY